MGKKKSRKKANIKEEPKQSNKRIILPLLIMAVAFVLGVHLYSNRTEPAIALKEYFKCLSDKNYEAMYDYIITDMSKEDFCIRVKNIYEGIEAQNISIVVAANTKANETEDATNITYTNSLDTIAGNVSFINTAKMKNIDGTYKIEWDSSMIFPNLEDSQKVRVNTINYIRGTIYDRNGIALAKEGTVYQVGLVPGKMNETTNLEELSNLLGISKDAISNALNADYVKEGTFVPLRKISREEQKLKNNLLQIKGVMITDVKARVYPYKEATSILTGYVQDKEGKAGMEYAYNDLLKGTDGKEIYIVNENEAKVKTIVKQDVKNGEDIKLTIDVNLQNKIYQEFKDDEGAQVGINYNTGEILALVSTPSYDANKFSIGITEEEWDDLQNDEKKPMYNRYLGIYPPGSSIKPIIGAIGLETESFTADEDFGRSGRKWQEDSSWNDLYVTTLEEYNGPANLENALIYSDNIYFAKSALKIGKKNLQKGLEDLGFNDKITFVQDIAKSSYGSMESNASIANSGYGQSEMLVNPIHLAMMYSSFANGGSIVMPHIEMDKESNENYYKQNAISKEIADTIKNDLIQVVERGTARDCKIDGKTIAGKTGTAEVKENQQDKDGTEIGWFNAFDENGTLIVSMVQNVKDIGGSHYVVKKVRNIFE